MNLQGKNGSEIWQILFGEVWKPLTEINRSIGAFAAIESTGEVLIDSNAEKLMGLINTPQYHEFITLIENMSDHAELGSPVRVKLLEAGEGITAGFLSVNEYKTDDCVADALTIISQAQLVRQMAEEKCDSLLALVHIEGVSNPAYSTACEISALNAMLGALPENAVIAAHSKLQYWMYVPNFTGDSVQLVGSVQQAVRDCSITDEFGVVVSERHSMKLTVGCSDNAALPARRLHTANFALFEAEGSGAGSICFFSPERYELQKNEYQNITVFSRLVEQNLFKYHFQPIVSARTGDVVAYEALMRTDESIGLKPLQILSLAERFDRLYDIEKATLRNTLTILGNNQEQFEKRKLFVNAITSHFLSDEDYERLRSDFGELLEKVVIELTEQTEISDEKLIGIKDRLARNNIQLAIDDYGTGYSNTSNLLRYNPDFVKIDRSLIAGIERKPKTQKVVSSIIEFLHASGYIALAEGVETYEELRTMIGFGADLIQGYYVSRPKPVLLHEVSESVREDIIRINLEAIGEIQKIYRPADGETVNLCALALEKYNEIYIEVPTVYLIGENGQTVNMPVTVRDNLACEIFIKNARISSPTAAPVLSLGLGSSVRLICEGDNSFELKGIFVPHSSSIEIGGTGSLAMTPEAVNSYGIGCDIDGSHGSITLNMVGKLDINAQGEHCVGIGGGHNSEKNKIRLLGGQIDIFCSGGSCVAVGTETGDSMIEISNCGLSLKASASNAVGIGSLSGCTEIDMTDFALDCNFSGANLGAVGVLNEGAGNVVMNNGSTDIVLRGRNLSCIGTSGGSLECEATHTRINLYCEGSTVSGIGDKTGGGAVKIANSSVDINFLTGDGWDMGSPEGVLEFSGIKNIKINE